MDELNPTVREQEIYEEMELTPEMIKSICPAWHDALCGVVSRRVQRGTAGSCAWQRPSHGDLPCWQG